MGFMSVAATLGDLREKTSRSLDGMSPVVLAWRRAVNKKTR